MAQIGFWSKKVRTVFCSPLHWWEPFEQSTAGLMWINVIPVCICVCLPFRIFVFVYLCICVFAYLYFLSCALVRCEINVVEISAAINVCFTLCCCLAVAINTCAGNWGRGENQRGGGGIVDVMTMTKIMMMMKINTCAGN